MVYDVDYRIIYTSESEDLFRERMGDAYIAHQKMYTPPLFDDLVHEFLDLQCKLFYENYQDAFIDFSEVERKELETALVEGEEWAFLRVQGRMDRIYVEKFLDDLQKFLLHNDWFYFDVRPHSNGSLFHVNSPLQGIW